MPVNVCTAMEMVCFPHLLYLVYIKKETVSSKNSHR